MILDQIVENKRRELEVRKHEFPIAEIQKMALETPRPLDFGKALSGDRVHLIAEVKKASPSKGVICDDFKPVDIACNYSQNGVAAISVLTENKYFQGSLEYLKGIKNALGDTCPPLLRKDFIFDPYQVYESRAYGADALLLIVAILDYETLKSLLDLSHRLEMQCLVEVHNEIEAKIAMRTEAEIIGINNRDLQTFKVDLNTTAILRPLIGGDRLVVSESGIKTGDDMKKLRQWHVNAALVGETLMTAPDIALKIRELQ